MPTLSLLDRFSLRYRKRGEVGDALCGNKAGFDQAILENSISGFLQENLISKYPVNDYFIVAKKLTVFDGEIKSYCTPSKILKIYKNTKLESKWA